jgi:shikimate dehydrogenase
MKKCITIGNPVIQSKGPTIKTFACELLGIADEYRFEVYQTDLSKNEEIDKLKQFILQNNVVGMSVTMPNKTSVIQMCDFVDDAAKFMNAVNTVAIRDGKLYGYNTDCIGIVEAIINTTNLDDKKIAILGSGGTTSAALYGFTQITKNITIFNRTVSKAMVLAQKFGVKYDDIININVSDFDIIINTTSVGFGNTTDSPINTDKISTKHIVFDAIYKPTKTKLLSDSERNGAQIIYGMDMLLYGTIPQIKYYTDHQLSAEQITQIKNFILS